MVCRKITSIISLLTLLCLIIFCSKFHKDQSIFCNLGGSTDLSEIRTSKNTWIKDGNSDLVDQISRRINLITGLQTTRKYDEFNGGKTDEYEDLQVTHLIRSINFVYFIL